MKLYEYEAYAGLFKPSGIPRDFVDQIGKPVQPLYSTLEESSQLTLKNRADFKIK